MCTWLQCCAGVSRQVLSEEGDLQAPGGLLAAASTAVQPENQCVQAKALHTFHHWPSAVCKRPSLRLHMKILHTGEEHICLFLARSQVYHCYLVLAIIICHQKVEGLAVFRTFEAVRLSVCMGMCSFDPMDNAPGTVRVCLHSADRVYCIFTPTLNVKYKP